MRDGTAGVGLLQPSSVKTLRDRLDRIEVGAWGIAVVFEGA
jgi:hypothetical protein